MGRPGYPEVRRVRGSSDFLRGASREIRLSPKPTARLRRAIHGTPRISRGPSGPRFFRFSARRFARDPAEPKADGALTARDSWDAPDIQRSVGSAVLPIFCEALRARSG